jgi:hypothetical protein
MKIVIFEQVSCDMFHNTHSWLHLFLTVFLHFLWLQFFLLWDVRTLTADVFWLFPGFHKPQQCKYSLQAVAGLNPLPPSAAPLISDQSNSSWLCGRPEFYWTLQILTACGAEMLTLWQPGSREMDRKGPGTRYILQRMPPVIYFLQPLSNRLFHMNSSMDWPIDEVRVLMTQ